MIEKVLRKPCRGEKEFWEEINATEILQTKTEAEFEQQWTEEQKVDAKFNCSAVKELIVACVARFFDWESSKGEGASGDQLQNGIKTSATLLLPLMVSGGWSPKQEIDISCCADQKGAYAERTDPDASSTTTTNVCIFAYGRERG